MKRKINGIVTIPAGLAQAEEKKIDSPTVQIIAGHPKSNGVEGEADVDIEVVYSWTQGSVNDSRRINRPFKWADMNDEQKAMIGAMIGESWNLLLSIPDHSDSEEV